MPPPRPLLSFDLEPLPHDDLPPYKQNSDDEPRKKAWYHHLPLCATVILILAPHPSLLYVLVTYHLQILESPYLFITHLLCTYTLTFMAFSSLIVCVVRDPGPVGTTQESEAREGGGVDLREALMTGGDADAPGRWCRKCWAPKPERTHHCSTCGRCVLKLDHHCPWLGSKCVGHRTYPAFLHFLLSITLLALYIAIISISGLWFAFDSPYVVNINLPVHELYLALAGIIFTFVIGPFLFYHIYLVLTNQTTIEHISPFLLLKSLPPLPQTGHDLSDPPLEPELSGPQRKLVRAAHGAILLYDVGWRQNWVQTLGCKRRSGWLLRAWFGGASPGDGRRFPRNPKAEEMLAHLADELAQAGTR